MRVETNEYLASCDECPLNGSVKSYTFKTTEENAEVVILGQSPGRQDNNNGRPFMSKFEQLANPIIEQYTNKIVYVNVLLCRPVENGYDRAPATSEISACRERLKADLSLILGSERPKVILAFGAVAKKEYQRFVKSNPQFASIPCYYLEHPAFISRMENRHKEGSYKTEIHNALKSVFNSAVVSDVEKSFVEYTEDLSVEFLQDFRNSANVGADIETNGLNVFLKSFRIGSIALACDKKTYWFDFRRKDIRDCSALKTALADSTVQKIFADVLYDVVALENAGIKVRNYTDLFPLAFMHDNTYLNYSLEHLVMRYKPEFGAYKSKFQSNLENHDYLAAPTRELMAYNCSDSWVTKDLYNLLYAKIDGVSRKLFNAIVLRVLPVLVDMTLPGLKVDMDLFARYQAIFEDRLGEIKKIFKDKHNVTNINSVPQIRKWLYEDLRLKPVKYAGDHDDDAGYDSVKKDKNPSTDKKVLEIYATTVPETKILYEARRISALLTNTMPSIKEAIDDDGFVHPKFKHYGVQSGRLSCIKGDSILDTNYGNITVAYAFNNLEKWRRWGHYLYALTPVGYRRVVGVYKTKKSKFWFKLKTKDKVIEVTGDHRILVDKQKETFVRADMLKVGDFIETINGLEKVIFIERRADVSTQFYDVGIDMNVSLRRKPLSGDIRKRLFSLYPTSTIDQCKSVIPELSGYSNKRIKGMCGRAGVKKCDLTLIRFPKGANNPSVKNNCWVGRKHKETSIEKLRLAGLRERDERLKQGIKYYGGANDKNISKAVAIKVKAIMTARREVRLPKNEVYELYIVKNLSISEVARHFNCDYGTVARRLRECSIVKPREVIYKNIVKAIRSRPRDIGYGSAVPYKMDGYKFRSSWEVVTYLYLKRYYSEVVYEPAIKVLDRHYYPDFNIGDFMVEVKGRLNSRIYNKLDEKLFLYSVVGIKVLFICSKKDLKYYNDLLRRHSCIVRVVFFDDILKEVSSFMKSDFMELLYNHFNHIKNKRRFVAWKSGVLL